MVINKSGITIRIGVDTLRVMGRATQGVKIIRLRDNDSIASVAKVSKFEEEDENLLDENGNVVENTEVIEAKSETILPEDENNNSKENNNEES
jgi:DNA gyrase subunit A